MHYDMGVDCDEISLDVWMGRLKFYNLMKINSSQAIESSSVAGTPEKTARKYTLEQWEQRLQALGVRNATLDRTAPRAFELPASGASPQKQD